MLKKIRDFLKKEEQRRRFFRKFKKDFSEYKNVHEKQLHLVDHSYLHNLKYEILDELRKGDVDKYYPQILTVEETLDDIIQNNKSVCRYGDGEFFILIDRFEDESYLTQAEKLSNWNFKGNAKELRKHYYNQTRNSELIQRLREVLRSEDENILICMPNCFGSLDEYNDGTKDVLRTIMIKIRKLLPEYINFDKTYGDTMFTRWFSPFRDREKIFSYYNKLKTLWNNKDILIVEGCGSRLGIGNDFFDNAKSIERVLCPAQGAYDKYDEILGFCKTLPKNKLVLIALGMTATILAYDLAKEGFQAIDIGHVDIEYDWYLGKIPEYKYFNEGGRYSFTELKDEKYESQIIKRIL